MAPDPDPRRPWLLWLLLALLALHQRRLRIEPVHSRVKRCRIVQDRLRLWKEGVRDRVMARGCALHNFRVRLTPWQPMIESG
jgi:MYXO-CTERM domain-containing protein